MSFQEGGAPAEQGEDQQPTENASTGPSSSQPSIQQQPGLMDPTKYKTKHCRNFMQKGHCNFGATCMFAHGDHDLQTFGVRPDGPRADPTKFKTKLCKHFLSTGTCPFMDRCGFAHGQMELNYTPPSMRPPLVGGFPHGGYEAAGYFGMAHHEMPPLPQMKRPPVTELAKTRLCKHFSATGTCPYESRCLFAHGTGDLRQREQGGPMAAGAPPNAGMVAMQQRQMQVLPGAVPVAVQHVPVGPPAGQAWPWSNQYAYMPSS